MIEAITSPRRLSFRVVIVAGLVLAALPHESLAGTLKGYVVQHSDVGFGFRSNNLTQSIQLSFSL